MIEQFKKHWIYGIVAIAAISVSSTWLAANELLVKPRDFSIQELKAKIEDLNVKTKDLQTQPRSARESELTQRIATLEKELEDCKSNAKRLEKELPKGYNPQQEVGIYRADRGNEAPVVATVTFENGKLFWSWAGQRYLLEYIGGRRYKLLVPDKNGFFVTFQPVKGNQSMTEMFLEQPHGDWTLSKIQ